MLCLHSNIAFPGSLQITCIIQLLNNHFSSSFYSSTLPRFMKIPCVTVIPQNHSHPLTYPPPLPLFQNFRGFGFISWLNEISFFALSLPPGVGGVARTSVLWVSCFGCVEYISQKPFLLVQGLGGVTFSFVGGGSYFSPPETYW